MESQGSLWEGVLPGLLRQLYVGRRTGALVLSRETERRTVHFYVGNIANAETNVREDRMGEMLVRKGLLSEADLMRATGMIHRDRKRLGEVLVEMRLLDREGLRQVVAFHADVVLSRVFAWTEGQYEFREDFGRALDADELTLPYSTGDLILRASRSVQDPDVVRYRLGDLERLVALSRDPLLRFQRLSLNAVDGCVLARVDGRTSAGEIVLATRLVPEEVRASLFALLNTGTIEYVGAAGRGSRAAARVRPVIPSGPPGPELPPGSASAPAGGEVAPPPRPSVRSEPSIVLSRGPIREDDAAPLARPDVPPGSEPGTAAPPPTAEPPAPPPTEARRAEILEAYESLATRTHFELLGLTPEADDAELREAYFRVAKRFHPDAHHDPGLSDLRDKLEAVFVRLGEVYETLRSPRLRARYERELARPSVAGGGPSAPANAELPEDAIARAAECIVRERYWEALPLLERAIPRASGGVRQRGRVLLARIYARDPDWVGQAEELLLSVLQDEPGNTEVHYYLGLIYEHQGQVERALSAFLKVLELEPQSQDVRARVAELQQIADAPEGGGSAKSRPA
jgi:hypothetical protein